MFIIITMPKITFKVEMKVKNNFKNLNLIIIIILNKFKNRKLSQRKPT